MKKLILASAVAITFSASAQVDNNAPVPAPKYSKIVICNAQDGVNIRKSPSTTAPRLVYDENKIQDFETPLNYSSYWSSGRIGGTVYAITFNSNAPLVSTADGWYEIAEVGPATPSETFSNGWVSAKYCSLSDIEPITPKVMEENTCSLRTFDNGNWTVYFSYNAMEGIYDISIGKIVDGQLVCPYNMYAATEEPIDGPSTIKKGSDGQYVIYPNKSEIDEEQGLVLAKAKESFLMELMKCVEKTPSAAVIYYDGSYLNSYSQKQ